MTPPVNTASLSASAGWRTLLHKEVQRFWKVAFQTIAAPVLTAVLYLLVFGHVLAGVFAAHPAIALGLVWRLRGGGHLARAAGGLRGVYRHLVLRHT